MCISVKIKRTGGIIVNFKYMYDTQGPLACLEKYGEEARYAT